MSRNKEDRKANDDNGGKEERQSKQSPIGATPSAESIPAAPVVVDGSEAVQAAEISADEGDDHHQEFLRIERGQLYLAGLLAFATIVTAGISAWQGCQAKEQLELANRGLRSRLGISPPTLVPTIVPGIGAELLFDVTNNGDLPAQLISYKYWVNVSRRDRPASEIKSLFDEMEPCGDCSQSGASIAPHDRLTFVGLTNPLSQEDIDAIKSTAMFVRLFASYTWTDELGTEDTTTKIYLYWPRFDKFILDTWGGKEQQQYEKLKWDWEQQRMPTPTQPVEPEPEPEIQGEPRPIST